MNKEKSTPTDANTSSIRPLKLASIGAAFATICLLFIIAFNSFQPDQTSLSDLYFPSPTGTPTLTPTPTPIPTSTPTSTPTPYAYLAPPAGILVYEEKFDTNSNSWDAYYKNNTTRIRNKKLVLRSNERGQEGLALCYGCENFTDNFYFQAELLPEKQIAIRYGISFCASESEDEYYVFVIDEVFSLYTLYKHLPDGQQTLINNNRTEFINGYPLSNSLGVRFESGTMDLYLNSHKINSDTDDIPLPCKWMGVFVEDGIFDLFIDNIFAYNVK